MEEGPLAGDKVAGNSNYLDIHLKKKDRHIHVKYADTRAVHLRFCRKNARSFERGGNILKSR